MKRIISALLIMAITLTMIPSAQAAALSSSQTVAAQNFALYLNRLITNSTTTNNNSNQKTVQISPFRTQTSNVPQSPSADNSARAVTVINGGFMDRVITETEYRRDSNGSSVPQVNEYLFHKAFKYAIGSGDDDFTSFLEDGWKDVNLVIGNKSLFTATVSKPKMVKNQMVNTLEQSVGTTRAVVATRILSNGKPAVLLAFSGTRDSVGEWLDNIVYNTSGGVHTGFSTVAKRFDTSAVNVPLPDLGRAIGRQNLTLADMVASNSNAVLFVCGYSRGGAIAQAFIGNQLAKRGFPLSRVFGYTFGSPTVFESSFVSNPSDFPIYNTLNAEDIVTKLGCQIRLGIDLVYHPTENFKIEAYNRKRGQYPSYTDSDAMKKALAHYNPVRTNDDAIAFLSAYSAYAKDSPTRSTGSIVGDGMMIMGKAMGLAAEQRSETLDSLSSQSDPQQVARSSAYLSRLKNYYGLDNIANINVGLIMMLNETHNAIGVKSSYSIIVNYNWGALQKSSWVKGVSTDPSYVKVETSKI